MRSRLIIKHKYHKISSSFNKKIYPSNLNLSKAGQVGYVLLPKLTNCKKKMSTLQDNILYIISPFKEFIGLIILSSSWTGILTRRKLH